ncbi:MAG: alpha/beta hydrolase [Bacteroidales bacterium]
MQEIYADILTKRLFARLLNTGSAGHGKPWLVFLHEGLGCTAQWRDFPRLLAEACNLPALLYDRWGYGNSERKAGVNKPDYMHFEAREMLPALLNHLGIQEPLILVGHSDGGTIALLFAAASPDRTVAVISECDHVICEAVTIQGVRSVSKAYLENEKFRQLLTTYHGDKTEELVLGWTGLWLSEEAAGWSIVDLLPSVKAPLLAIQGTDDAYGSVEQLVLKLRLCSGSVHVSHLRGCGHFPHHEYPNQVLGLMKNFIKTALKKDIDNA